MKKNKTFIQVFSLILVSIFLIALSAGYSIYKQNTSVETVIPPSTGADDIEDQIEPNPGDETGDESGDEPSEEKPPVQIYSNAFKCLEDAFALLDSCKGYKTTSTMTAITDILGMGSATQSVYEVATLSGDFYFKETFASCTSSMGQNYYRYFYSDDNGENVEYKKTSSYSSDRIPNWSNTIEQEVTSKETIIEKYDALAYDIFYIRADKSNSRLVKFDRSTNAKYYIISVVYDVSMIPDKYLKNAKAEGGLDSLSYDNLSLTYYIEKETLYIRKVERTENYSIKKGVSLNVSAYQELFVNIIDQEIAPNKPSYCN